MNPWTMVRGFIFLQHGMCFRVPGIPSPSFSYFHHIFIAFGHLIGS